MTERIVQSQCSDTKIDAITQALLQQATQSITMKGVFNLVLSNIDALDAVYARLMYDPDLRSMPWNETQLHFQDERLTSSAAEEKLSGSGKTHKQKKKMRDALAAAEILNDFLQK